MTFWIKGDCHGDFRWLAEQKAKFGDLTDFAYIILGDAGINFYLNKHDANIKSFLNDLGCLIYVLRGNHEARPTSLPNIRHIYDGDVNGKVWIEDDYPNIRYFDDFGIYKIDDYYTLVIGGAYSVDKWWRLARSGLQEENNNPKKSGWWPDEQLNSQEKQDCMELLNFFKATDPNLCFHLVLTHTCPLSFEPQDLFLPQVNQNSVDSSMEVWLEEIKNQFNWVVWLFGHFHADRIEQPYVEQFYHDVEPLENIMDRWYKWSNKPDVTLLTRSIKPNFTI